MLWIWLNQSMSELIDCGEMMWMTGLISFIVGAMVGAAVIHFLGNWK